MNKRDELYYVLDGYIKGTYDTRTFCYTISSIFFPDMPKNELSNEEFREFQKLAYSADRFSPYKEDFENCPNAFISEEKIRKLAIEIYATLMH